MISQVPYCIIYTESGRKDSPIALSKVNNYVAELASSLWAWDAISRYDDRQTTLPQI